MTRFIKTGLCKKLNLNVGFELLKEINRPEITFRDSLKMDEIFELREMILEGNY